MSKWRDFVKRKWKIQFIMILRKEFPRLILNLNRGRSRTIFIVRFEEGSFERIGTVISLFW